MPKSCLRVRPNRANKKGNENDEDETVKDDVRQQCGVESRGCEERTTVFQIHLRLNFVKVICLYQKQNKLIPTTPIPVCRHVISHKSALPQHLVVNLLTVVSTDQEVSGCSVIPNGVLEIFLVAANLILRSKNECANGEADPFPSSTISAC